METNENKKDMKDESSPLKRVENNENSSEETKEVQLDELDENQKKVNELSEKVNELNDRYLRLYSEFDNYRKRTAKERIELSKTAGEEIFKSMLPVVDDFERAIKSNETLTDIKTMNEGFHLIYNKLKNTLTQKGVEPMDAIGKEFNADVHEAITNIPAPTEDLKGKVVEEVEKGYSLHGKVIRFAKVIVGS